MIRFIRAFSWLRWRLMVNSIRGGERRDTLERASRVIALIAPAFLLVTTITSTIVAGVAGVAGGWLTVWRFRDFPWIVPMLRLILLLATVTTVLIPLFVGIRGGGARFTRLRLLPVSRGSLHLVELVSTLTDPWMTFLFPLMLGYGVGVMAGAAAHTEPWGRAWLLDGAIAVAAACAMAIVLAAVGSLVSFLVGWLVRDRRRSELFVLVFVLAISAVSMLPAFLAKNLDRRAKDAPRTSLARRGLPTATADLPRWTQGLPSELYARAITLTDEVPPPRRRHWLPFGLLFVEGIVCYLGSRAVYAKLMDAVDTGRSRRRQLLGGEPGLIRIPGFWPGTSAVAMAQVRTALRSVRGRLAVLLPGPLVAMLALIFRGVTNPDRVEGLLATGGYVSFGFGILFCLYAVQALTMNQFGSDRAGLTLQFLAPIRDVDLVKGKAAGCGIVAGAAALVCLVCALIVSPGGSPFHWLATLVGGGATFLVLTPVAAWLSALLPVASDLSKTGAGGNPHSLAMFAGTALVALAALPAAVILAAFSPATSLLLMTIWLLVAAAISYPLLPIVARTLHARRENLALVAQGR